MHCNSPILNYKTDQHILLQKFKTTFRIYYIWMGHLSSQNLNGLSKYLGYSNLIFMKRSCPDQEKVMPRSRVMQYLSSTNKNHIYNHVLFGSFKHFTVC